MEIGIANPKKQDTATLRLITSYNIQHSGKGIMKHWILVWKGSHRFDIKSNQYTFWKKKYMIEGKKLGSDKWYIRYK